MATIYAFGPFRLDAAAGLLFSGEDPLMLGSRAVALLGALLRNPGAPVSKGALIEAAWPGLAVEDSNLTVQIAAVRRALAQCAGGHDWIETLPRRGYRYVGPTISPSGNRRDDRLPIRALPEKPSVAVLPFQNLSDDPAQDYFADGVVDDIVIGLARIKWLFVIGRGSTSAYKGLAAPSGRVSRDLGVRYLLEGSVRKLADRVRITAQLVDAISGVQLWGDRYDRCAVDIFAVQDEIALAVLGAMEPSLLRAEGERVMRKRPENLDAYDLVLQAQSDIYSGMPAGSKKAIPLLDRALTLDPNYALAHGFAAMAYHNKYLRDGLAPDDLKASIRHAEAAIMHGRDDAMALTFAGFSIGMDLHDRAAAFAAFEAALEISPSTALAYILGSVNFGWIGEAQRAIEWAERGLRLSPLDPWVFAAQHSLMLGNFQLQRYDLAAKAAYKAVQCNPGHSISYMLLAAALVKLDRTEEAKVAAVRVIELQPGFRYLRQLAGVGCAPDLAVTLGEASDAAGLPG
ncbi:MAG TPA: winged helix-turn-helix domain-containing tetratricopeptide repeat protein [Roseiarcus sp.]|jgi:TolB-like protein